MSMDFSRQLIKGRIAEVIFERMFREKGDYTVIPFGYEQTVPTLAQYQHEAVVKKVMDNIGDAPDFILVSNNKRNVFLVEVKYRSNLLASEIKEMAKKLLLRWDPAFLFVATPQGFFFSAAHTITNKREIEKLKAGWIPLNMQKDYLALLNEFEKK